MNMTMMMTSRRSPVALLVLLSTALLLLVSSPSLFSSSDRSSFFTVVNAEAECDADAAGTGSCANPEAENVEVTDDSSESSTAATTEGSSSETEDPNCPSRDLIIRCAGQVLDTNKNNKLDREELESAIASLPWYARGILQILGSVDKMMKKCDVDGDGAIGMDYDMANNGETCLKTCFKRKAFRNSFFPDCE